MKKLIGQSTSRLNIALLGTRGIPARYGGFETFAEELATRLQAKGHKVTVFSRTSFVNLLKSNESYKGVTVSYAPTIFHKYLETPVHAFTSILKVLFGSFDAVLLCNAANSPFAWILRIFGKPVAINVDGIERKRSKWNAAGRMWYRLGEWCSVQFASELVGDAEVICDYYGERYGRRGIMIPYGAQAIQREPGSVLEKFGLKKDNYLLYVSRLEPENNALGVIRAFMKVKTKMALVIVGDAPYAERYKEQLHAEADDRTVFTGFQFGESYQELQSNCFLYIQATEVGGTHPALIEAMAYKNFVIANGTDENREVLQDCGRFYSVNNFSELATIIQQIVDSPSEREQFRIRAFEHVQRKYSWEAVTEQYEQLLLRVCSRSGI